MKRTGCKYTDELVCPHCEHKYQNSWELTGDDECGEGECPGCNKTFSFVVHRSTSYSTEPIKTSIEEPQSFTLKPAQGLVQLLGNENEKDNKKNG